MARYGIRQLDKLIINYCDHSGSSRGTREFLASFLPRFQEENPYLEVEAVLRRGHHPHMHATYKNGRYRVVDLRNDAPDEILRQAMYLSACTGRKASLRVKNRTQTNMPSIQGRWTTAFQESLTARR